MTIAAKVPAFKEMVRTFGITVLNPLATVDEVVAARAAVEAEYARVAEIATEAERIVEAWYDGEYSDVQVDIAMQELRTAINNGHIAAGLASLSADFPAGGAK